MHTVSGRESNRKQLIKPKPLCVKKIAIVVALVGTIK